MLACWQGEPKERPTFPSLVQILGDLLQDNSLPVRGSFYQVTMFWNISFPLKWTLLRTGRTTSRWTSLRAQKMMAFHRLHHGLHLRKNSGWPVTLCPTGKYTCHVVNVWGLLRYLSSTIFFSRYYNCVPFAGCVFVTPSKMCQPRVKTFEDLPLEVHPQKTPQVSPSHLCENLNHLLMFCKCRSVHHRLIFSQDNQTDSGMILASEELKRIEHQQTDPISKMWVTGVNPQTVQASVLVIFNFWLWRNHPCRLS